ncbi:MAG: putative nuclease with TOPRIM domain, partial [Cyclobacteriaceae bacterium]
DSTNVLFSLTYEIKNNTMDTKEQIENVVFHQTQCLNAIEDMKSMIEHNREDIAINKLKDLEKELTRLTVQLRQIEKTI